MNLQKLITFLMLCCISNTALPQSAKPYISPPLDLNQAGCNKVLCMKNGNTVLFHFEHNKRIIVTIYDSLHKQIAQQDHVCRIVDIYILKDMIFHGLYDINSEAVLFVEQEHLSKNRLIRLRFNSTDATLIEEKILGESTAKSKITHFHVMKSKQDEGYAILYDTDFPQFKECDEHVTVYNKNHDAIRDVSLDADRKEYDYLNFVGAEAQPNGICITLALSSLKSNGTSANISGTYGTAEVYNHFIMAFYIPTDSARARKKVVDVSEDIFPYYSNYTYNPFSKTLNLLLCSYKDVAYKNGLMWTPSALTANLFFKFDENNLDLSYNFIQNNFANTYLKQKDTTARFKGLPIKMYTNDNGLSTLISQTFTRFSEPETYVRTNYNTYLGNIAITQFDDDGNEIWGIVLPQIQCFKSYNHYYWANLSAKRWQQQEIFADLPEMVYNRQFFSLNTYSRDKSFYIVYNDYTKNFNSTVEKPGDTVYQFRTTNACYYKMNRKKEISKHYVFGEPVANEYIASFIEGADFDEQRGVYAALVQIKKNDVVTLCMAWSQLE